MPGPRELIPNSISGPHLTLTANPEALRALDDAQALQRLQDMRAREGAGVGSFGNAVHRIRPCIKNTAQWRQPRAAVMKGWEPGLLSPGSQNWYLIEP